MHSQFIYLGIKKLQTRRKNYKQPNEFTYLLLRLIGYASFVHRFGEAHKAVEIFCEEMVDFLNAGDVILKKLGVG